MQATSVLACSSGSSSTLSYIKFPPAPSSVSLCPLSAVTLALLLERLWRFSPMMEDMVNFQSEELWIINSTQGDCHRTYHQTMTSFLVAYHAGNSQVDAQERWPERRTWLAARRSSSRPRL